MKLRHVLSIPVLLLIGHASAQDPQVMDWQHAYGGSGIDRAFSVRQTSDGGFIVTGGTRSLNGDVVGSHGQQDLWVLRLDANGDLLWQKPFGGSDWDRAYYAQETSDGGFMIAGATSSNNGDASGNHGGYDAWVLKLDASGDLVWQNALGGSLEDGAGYIKETSGGGYIVTGFTYSNNGDVTGQHGFYDAWVLKLNTSGQLIWQNTLGGSGADALGDVLETDDGGFLFCGMTTSNDGDVTGNHGSGDAWLVELDAAGNLVWQATYGSPGDESAGSIHRTSDGGHILTGSVSDNGSDLWVFKLDTAANMVWQNTFGGSDIDLENNSWSTTDGGVVMTGHSRSNDGDITGNHGNYDMWVVKVDSTGNFEWERSIGGSGVDYPTSIQETADGSYVLAGGTHSNDGDVSGLYYWPGYNTSSAEDVWIVKLTPDFASMQGNVRAPNNRYGCKKRQPPKLGKHEKEQVHRDADRIDPARA